MDIHKLIHTMQNLTYHTNWNVPDLNVICYIYSWVQVGLHHPQNEKTAQLRLRSAIGESCLLVFLLLWEGLCDFFYWTQRRVVSFFPLVYIHSLAGFTIECLPFYPYFLICLHAPHLYLSRLPPKLAACSGGAQRRRHRPTSRHRSLFRFLFVLSY